MTRVSVDGELVGEMTIKVGPISGKFTGKVRLEDKVEPKSYRMVVDGRGLLKKYSLKVWFYSFVI